MSGLPASGAVDSQAIPLAVDIGWTMAVLFGQLRPGSVRDRLPTEHELPPDQRAQLEVARVNSLLVRLGALLPASRPARPARRPHRRFRSLTCRPRGTTGMAVVMPPRGGRTTASGRHWRTLLTPEGFVAAAEAALGRGAGIIRRIAVHYWFVLLILVIAVAAALYFADRDISGAGKIWTQIAAVSGGLGITVKGMGSAMARFSADAEKPIFGLEKIDAMAWPVTTIPGSVQKKLNGQGVRVLRRSGIPAPGPLGRV
jgi:hypothetical protein